MDKRDAILGFETLFELDTVDEYRAMICVCVPYRSIKTSSVQLNKTYSAKVVFRYYSFLHILNVSFFRKINFLLLLLSVNYP